MKIRRILDNIEIKLICLLLAVVMWFYANSSTGVINKARAAISNRERGIITFRDVPVDIESENAKEDARLSSSPKKILIGVSCPMTAEIDPANLQVKVRVTKKEIDKNKVSLSEENVILPAGLEFERAEPNEIRIYSKHAVEESSIKQNDGQL